MITHGHKSTTGTSRWPLSKKQINDPLEKLAVDTALGHTKLSCPLSSTMFIKNTLSRMLQKLINPLHPPFHAAITLTV
jgi:hypothetical protein